MKIPRCVIRDEKLFQFHITDRVNTFRSILLFFIIQILNSKLSLSIKQNENAILDREIRFQIRINYKMARLNSVERLEIDGATSNGHCQICAWARIQIIRFTRWPCIFIVIKPCQVVAPISLCNYPAPLIILFYLFFSFFFFEDW